MRPDTVWSMLIVLAASLTVSSLVPRMIGYVVVSGVYALFVGVLLATDRFAVIYHWAFLPLVMTIWLVFALVTLLDPTGAGIVRLGAFVVITGINLFVVPAVLNRSAFCDTLSYLAGLFVLIGLLTVFIGTYGIGGLSIAPWHVSRDFFGVTVSTPLSIFDNPNYLAAFSTIGAIAAGDVYTRSRTPLVAGLIGLNALGVVLAGGRAALLALVVAGGLYIVYRFLGRSSMALCIGIGGIAVVAGFAMAFKLVPGPSVVANVDLSHRRIFWQGAYQAILSRPVFGWGPGNDIHVISQYVNGARVNATHNSYLRMYLISGVLGGGAYLLLSLAAVVSGLRNTRPRTVFVFLLLIVFLVLQLFAGMTMFGLSLLSMLGAMFIGYIQAEPESATRVEIGTEIRRRVG